MASGSRDDLWVFGYGSLVWRPAFPHAERHHATIRGFARRFYQASPDHRGTERAPGRVVTLVDAPGAICWGAAYRVAVTDADDVLAGLDYREKAGYRRESVDIELQGSERQVSGLVYMASSDNPNFVGPEPPEAIAAVVRQSVGPSGSNLEYVVRLADALAAIGGLDDHTRAIYDLVRDDRS